MADSPSKKTTEARRKYLTEVKESSSVNDSEKRKKEEVQADANPKEQRKEGKEKKMSKTVLSGLKEARLSRKDIPGEDGEEVKSKSPFTSRDIILSVINLISLVLLVIILTKLPEKAKHLNDLKVEQIKNESGVSFEFSEIEVSKQKADEIEELFLDEAGVIDFVNEIEQLKGEGSAVSEITFASQDIVKDKTGNFGVPVVIKLQGSWSAIGSSMRSIQSLPFFFRAAVVDISLDKQNPGVVKCEYGGFLYVKDRLGKN